MRNSLIATLIAGAFMSLNAQAADLLQIYKQALTNDPVFASARASMMAGEETIAQGRSGLLPNINVSGSYTSNGLGFTPAMPNAAIGDVDYSTHYPVETYTVALTQPLFRMANWQQYQIGVLSAASTEAQFAQAQEDLMLRVAQAYFDVLTAQDTLASIQANKVAITEQLASAKRNFEVGTTTITDTNEAQSRYDLAVAQELAAQNSLEISRTALEQIIGKPPGDLSPLRTGVKLTLPEPSHMDKWVDSAEHENFNVVGQKINVEIAQRTIKLNRAGHYPTADFVAQRVHTNQGGDNLILQPGVTSQTAAGVQWNIPIFSGFAVDSKVKQSIALEDKAEQDLENARRTAAQAARQSYLGVSSGLSQVTAYEAAEVSSQSSLDSNLLGYQVGIRINIDVLNAQQQLYTTRQTLAKARYDTIVNGLRLKSASGSLKEDDLMTVNSLLTH
ncbi:MAG TPA: TolC family outer membrane protein [Burkholderiaceae bacterium]|jgi:outer membrane protein|nr:TolC family outer membrane protein [Burkholderiaceae bacterium]